MHRIFLGLVFWTCLFLIGESVLGVLVGFHTPLSLKLAPYHALFGVFLAIFVCLVHVMVMFHFIGSGKELKEAIAFLGGEPETIREIKRFKARVFPLATFSMLFTIAAEVIGGGVQTGAVAPFVHLLLAIIALGLNFLTFPVEYNILKRNLDLIQLIDTRLQEMAESGQIKESQMGNATEGESTTKQ